MANCCGYEMKVIGPKMNCKKLLDILQNKSDREFDRVYEAYLSREYGNDDRYIMEISGDCAWSVMLSMIDSSYRKRPGRTSLAAESKRLKLDIEVYSAEPEVGFAEHYRYQNGTALNHECVDYEEFWWDHDSYPTIKKLNAEYGTTFSEDDFDENSIHIEGGFGDWDFAA